jgi:hypothetical protein
MQISEKPFSDLSLGSAIRHLVRMSGHLDSESVFRTRLQALGISDASIATLVSSGVSTMAKLAYISPVQPGTADDAPFFLALSKALKVDPGDISVGDQASYRRAWYEAATVAIAEVRYRVERSSEEGPRKMPQPERINRLALQQQRLGGIRIEGSMEPSHALLDKVWMMRDDDCLKLLPPEECTSRAQEVLGVKKENFIKIEAGGTLKQLEKEAVQTADLSTEYRVRLALTRRSLALDNVGLATFDTFEDYHTFLYSLVMKEPLPTHHPVTVSQILAADKQLFVRLVELTRTGILPTPTGTLPLDDALKEARLDPLFTALLQPLPKPSASSSSPYKPTKGFADGSSDHQGQGPYSQKGKGGSKGKGRGRGRGKREPKGMPEELKNLRTKTNKGQAYCWGFNMAQGCTGATAGRFCQRGFHGCMGCGAADHGHLQCPKKK